MKKLKPIIYGSLSGLWTVFIIFMSTQSAESSSGTSRGILKAILAAVYNLTKITIEPETVHNLFRKFAHFTEFFILGIFVVLFFKSINKNKFLAVIYGFLIAFLDELTQFFTGNGRAMRFSDMMIDTAGVLFAVLFLCIIFRKRRRASCV